MDIDPDRKQMENVSVHCICFLLEPVTVCLSTVSLVSASAIFQKAEANCLCV